MIKFQINLWTCPCCFAFIFIPFPLRFCSIFLWACHVIYWALRKYGSHRQYTRQLQSVFNAAARLVFSTRKSEHVTPLLQELHWLKVPERIQFRLCVLVHRCLHGNAPPYLAETLYAWRLMLNHAVVSGPDRHRHYSCRQRDEPL